MTRDLHSRPAGGQAAQKIVTIRIGDFTGSKRVLNRRVCIENREVSGGFMMTCLRDSAGIIPIILLILGAIVVLFILLRIISC